VTEPMDDEQWAAGLRGRTLGAIPPVPVDVAYAVRQGRRRRAVRTGAVRGGILFAACGVAFAVVPSVVGGWGTAADQGAESSGAQAGSPLAPAPAADVVGEAADDGGARQLTASELASELSEGTLPTGVVLVVQEGVPDTSAFLTSLGSVSLDDANGNPTPVARGQWSRATVECLVDDGWQAAVTADGWQVELAGDKSSAFLSDLADCVETHPVE
jgi:hypothetical protein